MFKIKASQNDASVKILQGTCSYIYFICARKKYLKC